MKKIYCLLLLVAGVFFLHAQTNEPAPWTPANARYAYPRTLLTSSEVNTVKQALTGGFNIGLYHEVYASAMSLPPVGNFTIDDKRGRASVAKNGAFVLLLDAKPSGSTLVTLPAPDRAAIKTKCITLLEEINPFISEMSSDSPSNYIEWQWSSKQMIDYCVAYDLLKGSGATDTELAQARIALRNFIGNLYEQTSRKNLGVDFFQGAKNNHALMSAGALGIGAVVLNDLTDSLDEKYKPMNWINSAMWNIHNVIWWDIRKQSLIGTDGGYAEGSHYFRYAFTNLLPFFKAIGNFLPDTSAEYTYNELTRKIRNPWYDTNYVRIYDLMTAIRMPDGRMPPIEDSYTYESYPDLAILGKAKYNWALHLSTLDQVQNNTLSDQLTSISDMRTNYIAANVPASEYSDSLYHVYPDAGIAVYRSSPDSNATYFAMLGKNGTILHSTEAHNHADDGSFLMMVNGQMMALDPGYLSFEMRDTVANAYNHNMILINDAGPLKGIPGKSFGAEAYIEKYFSSPAQQYTELRTSYEGADINRKVLFVRKKYFLLADHVTTAVPKKISWLLHGYGLEGGDNFNTGTFTDAFANKKAWWQRRQSGLFATVTSDAPITFEKLTGIHEYRYVTPQNHTYMKANTNSSAVSYLTCLQPFTNLQTDTMPVQEISIPGTTAYRFDDNNFHDMAVSQGSNNVISSIPLQGHTFSTDAKFFWSSTDNTTLVDLFMHKGTFITHNNIKLFEAAHPMNIQYLQTGAKTFGGYCGDTGMVQFFTGEYTYNYTATNYTVSYDLDSKSAWVHFLKAGNFTFTLDSTKTGIEELLHKEAIRIYPVPANEVLHIAVANSIPLSTTVSDLAGRQLMQTTSYDIDVSFLPNGIYLLSFSNNGRMIRTEKFVVVR